jgi:hypothetical protein
MNEILFEHTTSVWSMLKLPVICRIIDDDDDDDDDVADDWLIFILSSDIVILFSCLEVFVCWYVDNLIMSYFSSRSDENV